MVFFKSNTMISIRRICASLIFKRRILKVSPPPRKTESAATTNFPHFNLEIVKKMSVKSRPRNLRKSPQRRWATTRHSP